MKTIRIHAVVLFTILLLLLNVSVAFAQQTRGAGNVKVKNETTGKVEEVKLYKGSYALVIGMSDYTNGWQKLEGVKTDVPAVAEALTAQGFEVTKLLNPKKSELVTAIEKFINDHGYDYENRLLIYYAGHGHTQKSGAGFDQGFIVPVDAPLPTAANEAAFRRTAISMDTIERYAGEINAKHALFVFDSCFSGALITKTRSSVPPLITTKTTQPVRQFITAGSDDQEVPDVSEFRKQFVAGLKGDADRNADEFITVSELADFLQDKVSRYTKGAQTPQYGKIRDARLDKGDFVFILPRSNATASLNAEPNFGSAASTAEIEREAFIAVQNSTDANEIRAVLEEYPNSKYAPAATAKLDRLVWESVKNSRDRAKIQIYLDEFKNGQYASAARIEIRKLTAVPSTSPPIQTETSNSTAPTTNRDIKGELYYFQDANGKYGFKDSNNSVIIEAAYESVGTFSEGLAWVRLGDKEGYIDKTGKIVIAARFDYAGAFENGRAYVKLNGREFQIDKNGSEIK